LTDDDLSIAFKFFLAIVFLCESDYSIAELKK
jgi:hypothetical protein